MKSLITTHARPAPKSTSHRRPATEEVYGVPLKSLINYGNVTEFDNPTPRAPPAAKINIQIRYCWCWCCWCCCCWCCCRRHTGKPASPANTAELPKYINILRFIFPKKFRILVRRFRKFSEVLRRARCGADSVRRIPLIFLIELENAKKCRLCR